MLQFSTTYFLVAVVAGSAKTAYIGNVSTTASWCYKANMMDTWFHQSSLF